MNFLLFLCELDCYEYNCNQLIAKLKLSFQKAYRITKARTEQPFKPTQPSLKEDREPESWSKGKRRKSMMAPLLSSLFSSLQRDVTTSQRKESQRPCPAEPPASVWFQPRKQTNPEKWSDEMSNLWRPNKSPHMRQTSRIRGVRVCYKHPETKFLFRDSCSLTLNCFRLE